MSSLEARIAALEAVQRAGGGGDVAVQLSQLERAVAALEARSGAHALHAAAAASPALAWELRHAAEPAPPYPSDRSSSGDSGASAVDAALLTDASPRIARAADALRATAEARGAAFDDATLRSAAEHCARVAGCVDGALVTAERAARLRRHADALLACYSHVVDAGTELALRIEARVTDVGGSAAGAVGHADTATARRV